MVIDEYKLIENIECEWLEIGAHQWIQIDGCKWIGIDEYKWMKIDSTDMVQFSIFEVDPIDPI